MRRHFPLGSPQWGIVHEREGVASGNDVGNVVDRTFRVYSAFLVQQIVDCLTVEEDYEVSRTHFQGEYPTILLTPFFESVQRAKSAFQLPISNSGEDQRTFYTCP